LNSDLGIRDNPTKTDILIWKILVATVKKLSNVNRKFTIEDIVLTDQGGDRVELETKISNISRAMSSIDGKLLQISNQTRAISLFLGMSPESAGGGGADSAISVVDEKVDDSEYCETDTE
jgi:hypothetical protein